MSRRSQRRDNISDNEENEPNLDEAVKACVRYFVCRESNKIPIKRGEIVSYLSTSCQLPTSQVNVVIAAADRALKKVYGYKLVQVQAKSGIQYIVVLNSECESLVPTNLDMMQRRLLTATLLHIYMSGGAVKEDDLWKFLAEAGLLEENDFAGRKILTNTFTRQMYLKFFKVGDGDLARNVFEWGQRATEELPKRFLLNKLAQAFEKSPDYWYEQYKEATEEGGGAEPTAS